MTTTETHLFDKKAHWIADPMTAFGGFVESVKFVELGKRPKRVTADGKTQEAQPLGARSIKGYVAMFSKFVRWMQGAGLSVDRVTKDHILQFLDVAMEPPKKGSKKDLNSEIRNRYVRLLERVYDHLRIQPNPARLASYALGKMPGGRGKDLPKEWLTLEQQAAFMKALPTRSAQLAEDSTLVWRRRRDRAMMALMIGAGLTVSEVIELYIENIGEPDDSGSVPVTVWPVPGSQFGRKHVTMLRPFAVPEVMNWLEERATMKVPGQILFPAMPSGGKVKAFTLYRQVRTTFTAAGITLKREGGRTLRNTFAQRELEAGTSLADLEEYLGLHDRRSAERYAESARVRTPPAPVPIT